MQVLTHKLWEYEIERDVISSIGLLVHAPLFLRGLRLLSTCTQHMIATGAGTYMAGDS